MARIDPARWQTISGDLDRALDMDDGARAAWLAALRDRDPALASELQFLLDEHRAVIIERFLEDRPVLPAGPQVSAGQTVGAYRLIALIGEGGDRKSVV